MQTHLHLQISDLIPEIGTGEDKAKNFQSRRRVRRGCLIDVEINETQFFKELSEMIENCKMDIYRTTILDVSDILIDQNHLFDGHSSSFPVTWLSPYSPSNRRFRFFFSSSFLTFARLLSL